MATKKISDLFKLSQLSEDDEFVVVDKSTTGSAPETGLGGRTTKVTFKDLKEAVGTSGPQGERGPQGNAGPQGPIGPVGPMGPIGPIGGGGSQGERGPVGPIGPKGDQGVAGPVGPRGDSGPRGPSGAAADRGPKGDKGDTGARGAVGPQGSQGVPGERGATGPMGRQGDKGATGKTGPMGPKGKDGANGATGATGQTGKTGATGPTGRAGIDSVRNFCSDKNWPIGRHLSYADEDTGGNFDPNGGSAENEVVWGEGPFGYNVKIWQARKNDRHSGGDGGWNKKITGLDKNKSYVSVTYVRRTNASTNGTFYHGPDLFHADNCLNLNGTLNRNPYFSSFNIGVLPLNAWCISIGYVHANNDPSQKNNPLSGLYRLDTGQKLRSYVDYKMKNSISGHRTYLFYSTDPNASLDWCLPGFYEVNSDCPVYRQLLGLAGISGTGGSGGEAGPQGPSGPQGPKGDRGPTGPQGPRGYTGPQGIQGPKGNTGSTGARGSMPSHGWSGTSLRFIQSNGSWGSYVNLKGATGARGLTGARGPAGPAGSISHSTSNNITFSSGLKAISNDSINTSVPFYANPKSTWPGYFEGKNLAFQIRTQAGTGSLARYADWGADGNGFARVRGQVGVGLLDGRGPDWYGTEIARFQDNGIICRRHILIRNNWDSTRSLSLRPARINIAGHANTNFEGGELRMHYPYNIDTKQEKFAWVDMYYDYNKIYTQYRCGQLRLGHNGYAGLMISEVGHHTMDGHLYLWDGLNNSVIMQNKPGDTRNSNLVIRHAPSKTTYQDNFRLQKNNGNLGIRGVFVARQAWGVSDINKKKDIEPLVGNESLEKLLELNPVKFNWKDIETREKQMGLIAQEVEPILPSVVDDFEDFGEEHDLKDAECDPRNEDNSKCKAKKMSKTVSYTELVPLLISAIQEQQRQIDTLKSQLESK